MAVRKPSFIWASWGMFHDATAAGGISGSMGLGSMTSWRFALYNILGGILWILILGFGGRYFGNIPLVRNNFTLAIFANIMISGLPAIIEILSERYRSRTH
jgi:membrane protein DedA with SNARE-associated domain